MNAKLLSQATSQLIIENPNETEAILGRLEKLVKTRYPSIKFTALVKSITGTVAQQFGIKQVEIVTAGKIPPEQLIALMDTLGENIDISAKTQPNILGGIILKKDGKQLDMSLKNKLNNLRQSLRNVEELHE